MTALIQLWPSSLPAYLMKTEIIDRQNLLQGKGYVFNLISKFSLISVFFLFFCLFCSCRIHFRRLVFLLFFCFSFSLFFFSTEDELAEVFVDIFAWFSSSYFATAWQNPRFFTYLIFFFIYYLLSWFRALFMGMCTYVNTSFRGYSWSSMSNLQGKRIPLPPTSSHAKTWEN